MLKQIISLLFGLLFAEPSLSAHEAGLGLIRQGPAHPVSRLMAENPAAKTMDEPALETAASAVDQRGNTDSAIVEEGAEDDAAMCDAAVTAMKLVRCKGGGAVLAL